MKANIRTIVMLQRINFPHESLRMSMKSYYTKFHRYICKSEVCTLTVLVLVRIRNLKYL